MRHSLELSKASPDCLGKVFVFASLSRVRSWRNGEGNVLQGVFGVQVRILGVFRPDRRVLAEM